MLKKSFFGALTPLVVGFVFVFCLIGCDDGANGNKRGGGNNNGGSNSGDVTPIDPQNGGEIDNPINGGDNPGGNEPVLTLTEVTATSPSSLPSGNLIPYLYLKFNRNASLSINDITISGVSGVTKGGLTDTDHGNGKSYNFGLKIPAKTSGTLTVSIKKSGKEVNGSPKTVYVYNNSNSASP